MSRAPSAFQLEQAMTVLLSARQRLLNEDPDIERDEKLFSDMLEGESGNALDVIGKLLRAAVYAADMCNAAEQRAEITAARAKRWDARDEYLRGIAYAALEAAGLSKLELPDLVATLKDGSSHVIITDETLIPDQYVQITRTPMKTDIGKELRAGRKVPGAELSNRMPALQIRTR